MLIDLLEGGFEALKMPDGCKPKTAPFGFKSGQDSRRVVEGPPLKGVTQRSRFNYLNRRR